MRTTLRLPDELFRRAKEEAARNGTSLTAMVSEALAAYLARLGASHASVELPAAGSDGLQPGVDLDDSSSLHDIMEE
ncbi:MAG: ribbon-helix-helix protein, CopG family [Gemmatimonadales bacterium]